MKTALVTGASSGIGYAIANKLSEKYKVYGLIRSQKNTDASFANFTPVVYSSFRISQYYLKNMRKNNYSSKIVNFPFKNVNGYFQYEPSLQKEMENFVFSKIVEEIPPEKVFLWKE